MHVCAQCATENPEVAKFCLACGSPLEAAPPPQEFRKIVTIVFSDLKGSTSLGEQLDSESLREVMTRYFDAMRAELERHGGVIEKFIGDAVMAVFGLPKLHEDDALRAVRAAAGMQQALAELNDELELHWGVRLANRTGVNTGEVVAGDPTTGQRLVTGDAVNVAARLEQAAGEREVLLGDLTYRLVRDYVDVETVDPLALKGKAEPVPAYRLAAVREDAERPRRLDAPLVGRDRELEQLSHSLHEAVETRQCRLVTVVGEAGVGKSRLIDEFVQSVEGEVSFLRGRCLAYGDGITFWPLAEAIRQASGILERDTTETALQKLSALSGDAEAEERVASAIGLSQSQFPLDELFWGARKLLEALARPGPLLVLFEDIHWAEATFLELIEHVVNTADDACLLIVCTTRHELVQRRPEWSTLPHMSRIELERLTEDETTAVAEHLLGMAGIDDRVRSRVIEAADGNPLFVEQLLSMLIDEGLISFENGCWHAAEDLDRAVVPPTIQALLAARLDYLEHEERAVIEPASVVGHVFVKDAVTYLVPDHIRDDIGVRLGSLTDKQLVHPDLSRSLEEEAFRFHHILIRDTAYEGILKRTRADLHERFVEWADSVNREGAVEYEEILGYHLEQAFGYLSELGPLDDHGRALGSGAAGRLASAGRRAFTRGDMPAAANLLHRAAELYAFDDMRRLEVLPDLGEALMETGDFATAETLLDEAVETASMVGDPRLEADALLTRLLVRHHTTTDLDAWRDAVQRETERLIPVLEQESADAELAKAWRMVAFVHGPVCRWAEVAAAQERAIEHARKAGRSRQEARAASSYTIALRAGPTPVDQAIARCEKILETGLVDRQAEALVLCSLAYLEAMRSEFGRARELYSAARALFVDIGATVLAAHVSLTSGRVELLAGDAAAAERELRADHEALEAMGERYFRPLVTALLAGVVCLQGRFEEAESLAEEAAEMADDDDVETQALLCSLRAKLVAETGEFERSIELAQRAVGILAPTDEPVTKANAIVDLAEILLQANQPDQARALLEEARAMYEAKGDVVSPERVDLLLAKEQAPVRLA